MVILLLGCAASAPTSARAQGQAGGDSPAASATAEDEHGAYLSLGFGNGRMHGENENGTRWMRGRAFEARAGRDQENVFGNGRIDFVHYNEGHPENNHRDGFALQWVAVRPLGASFTGELGIGPYLSMNTTTGSDGREIDDARWGLLLSAALRVPLDAFPDGTHLRLGLNHALMSSAYSSTAVTLGLGRQFGPARPEPDTEPISGPWWFGASVGWSVTNMSGTESAHAGVLEARKYLGPRMEHWAVSGKLVIEGDDGTRVDRRGIAGQLWYVQQVTPRFSMSAGIGPYLARNRREDDDTRANLLISFQAERALSRQTRAFINFNRIKTFRETNERDLFQVGVLKRF
jgi:hypothetical protein